MAKKNYAMKQGLDELVYFGQCKNKPDADFGALKTFVINIMF